MAAWATPSLAGGGPFVTMSAIRCRTGRWRSSGDWCTRATRTSRNSARKLGGPALRETAALFDIPLTRGDAPERLRDTLPFAAYGQGEVLATPFRMARVAAAIAADGALPPARRRDGGRGIRRGGPVRVLDEASARRLADAMRQVVVSGTGGG